MRSRLPLLTILCAVTICAGAHAARTVTQEPGPPNVYLGGAVFVPNNLTRTGTSTLKVSVATTPAVPSTGANGTSPVRAAVQISENSNLNGISYSVTPSQLREVELDGAGRSTLAEFQFEINSQNNSSGNISYKAMLVRLENAQAGVQMVAPTAQDAVLTIAAPTPTPTPTPPPDVEDFCDDGRIRLGNKCISPLIIDTQGDGFGLTSAAEGVNFDLDADGIIKERAAWTAPASDDAFLFLDRNGNGVVDNGIELFGNYTPQRASPAPNGFVALALYDMPLHGGNDDGTMNADDAVFSQLRLWRDVNHNGLSEPDELLPLSESDIKAIDLDYKESRRRDRHGNLFRYRAKIEGARHARPGRWAYDVFLRVGEP
jgi:hypothetical protein